MERSPNRLVECNSGDQPGSLGDSSSQASAESNSSDSGSLSDGRDESSSSGEDVNSDQEENHVSSDSDEGPNCENNSDANSDEDDNPLYDGSEMSASEAVLAVLKLYIDQKWTKTSLDKNVKLIKRLLPYPNDFPSSGKSLLKKLENLSCTYNEEVQHMCSNCGKLLLSDTDKCTDCDCDETGKYYYLPIKDQIKHMFEQRNLAEVIDQERENRNKKEGHICDIQDGSAYKSVKEKLQGQYDLILLSNSDGVALSGSSNRELWLLLATICEVPIRLRPSYMMVCGIYVGTQKPNMNEYMSYYVKSLQDLYENGVNWVHPVSKQSFTSKGTAPAVSADAPAKALILNHNSHNSRYACNICEQKTKKIDLTAQEVLENQAQPNPRKRIRRKRRFVYQDDIGPAQLRTGERMEMQGILAETRSRPRKGVLGTSTLSGIPLIDRAECVCAEYLHLVALGVVKYFLLKILFDNGGEWYLGDHITDMDSFMNEIKVPDFVKRLPRKLSELKYWKGSELRNFLLFYSLPIFKGRLPDKYYQHWVLLVGSIHILLKEQISELDLESADLMLRAFVRDVGPLYGRKCYTYNVHTLLHLCLLVKRWGPLYATSGFVFENFNGFIASHIHGTKNFGQELINNIKVFHSTAVLENQVNAGPHAFPRFPNPNNILLLGKACSKAALSDEERLAISELVPGGDYYVVHYRAKVMSSVFTTEIYDQGKKRSNSFVQFSTSDGNIGFGQITAFIKFADHSIFCCLNDFKITHVNVFMHEPTHFVVRSLIPFELKDSVKVIPVKALITKLSKVGSYLALRPNSYEINL
jgi:hypothetical protein